MIRDTVGHAFQSKDWLSIGQIMDFHQSIKQILNQEDEMTSQWSFGSKVSKRYMHFTHFGLI